MRSSASLPCRSVGSLTISLLCILTILIFESSTAFAAKQSPDESSHSDTSASSSDDSGGEASAADKTAVDEIIRNIDISCSIHCRDIDKMGAQ